MPARSARFISALLLSASVAACAVGPEANRQIRSTTGDASSMLSTAAAPMAAKDTRPVRVNSGVFVGSHSIRNDNGDPLPSRLEGPSGLTIVRTSPTSLREIAAAVTEHTKIPVVLAASSASGTSPSQQSGQQGGSVEGFAPGEMPPGFPINEALAQISASNAPAITASSSGVSAEAIPLNYSGPLSGFLDIITAHFNVAWKYERGRIVLESVVTRSFDVPALSVASEMEFDLTSRAEQSGGDGASSSSGQMASSRSETNVFSEIEEGLSSLVGEGSFAISRSTGTVTVTASPATITRVSDYLSSVNQRLAEQVAVSVKVYSVSLNDNEEFDLNVAGIFNQAGQYGIAAGNMAASGGVVPSPSGAGGPGLGWALLDTSHSAYGSQALVNALATRGDVSVVTTASVTTLNGVPVPLQVGEVRDYVRSVTVNQGDDTTAPSASIDSATVSTGFSLQLTPRVERNSDILLQYGINISELTGSQDGFDTFETMGSTVQLRRMNQRNFIQQARIPNGNTLVLAGFEQVRSESVRRGTGRASFPLLGGGNRSAMRREIVVITITPTLLRGN